MHFEADQAGLYCGGCALQHLTYAEQLSTKASRVASLLQEAGVDSSLVEAPIAADNPWFYRNKMEFSFGTETDGRYALGLHPPGRRWDILRLESCFLQSEDSTALLRAARGWGEKHGVAHVHPATGQGWLRTLTIREGKGTGHRMVELTTSPSEEVSYDGAPANAETVANSFVDALVSAAEDASITLTSVYWTQHVAKRGQPTRLVHRHCFGADTFDEKLTVGDGSPLTFELHPRAFFQPNTFQAQRLYAEVVAATQINGVEGAGHVLDLYCGTGTIALCLAPHASKVTGIELVEEAVVNARANALKNGLENVTFFAGDVGEVLEREGLASGEVFDAVVVDPPRAGLMPGAIEQLMRLSIRRLVYVSCNPEALARDIPSLVAAGFSISRVQTVDMFPQTAHIETVAVLTQGDGDE